MWEQRKGLKFHMFGESSSDGTGSSSSSSSSSGGSSGSKLDTSSGSQATSKGLALGTKQTGVGNKSGGGFVSRLGFKFEVANFDINAVSPTSW